MEACLSFLVIEDKVRVLEVLLVVREDVAVGFDVLTSEVYKYINFDTHHTFLEYDLGGE